MKQINLQENLRKKFIKKGVKMIAPDTVFFSKDTKIGTNVEKYNYFLSRDHVPTKTTIIHDQTDTADDYITSRIMWLTGLEEGFNRGGKVDSFKRYIYIHGTHEEGLIGQKSSHGCIRMFNHDVIELFELIPLETLVDIGA